MKTRRPAPQDYSAISDLIDRAFAPSISESELVRNLRQRGVISLDMVIEQDKRILAYISFTRAYDAKKNAIGFHLAPLAVLPGWQQQGLGQQLIRDSLPALAPGAPVYVLGDPEYYSKTGFRIDRTQRCLFDSGGNHFMVLSPVPLPPRQVGYEQEFYDLAGLR